MIINVKGKEVTLKYSFKSMMMFENITNKSFAPSTLTDVMVFMLCVILASSKDTQLTFEELIDMVDENPRIVEEFSDWLTNEVNKQNLMSQDKEVVVDDEKKTK